MKDTPVRPSDAAVRGPPSRRRGRAAGPRRTPVAAGTERSRRRPIFPKGCPLSIFGAGELDFRVRYGNGYGLSASVTGISVWSTWIGCTCTDWLCSEAARPGSVGRGSKVSDLGDGSRRTPGSAAGPWPAAEEVKPSTISTAQLHPSPDFHMPPIEQVVYLRSYPVDPVGNLISRRASHLDAFSAYPDRTWLPSDAPGGTTGTPAVRPLRSSRTRSSSAQVSYAHTG
jgi:hypothetical protein